MNKNMYLFEVSMEGRADTLTGFLSHDSERTLRNVPHRDSNVKLNVKFHGSYEAIQAAMSKMFDNE